MPQIIIQLEENVFKLLLNPAEADTLMEICVIKEASIIEMLEAIFVIGSSEMIDSVINPNPLT